MTSDVPDSAAIAEAIVAAAGDGLIAVDETGTVVAFNPAAAAIFGRDPGEMIGKPLESLFVPDMIVAHQRYVSDYFHGRGRGVVGSTLETVGQHSSGRAVPIEISLTATSVGPRGLVVASIRDISRRREADERNQALMEQLTQAQKMEALGTLAAGVAHDFNNMLGAIMGYASAMVRELSESPHRHSSDVTQILTVARRAKRLTDKLLAMSRQSDFRAEPLSLGRVVQDVVALLRRTIPKSIAFRTRLERDLFVEGDRTQLEQLVMNICLNARDAMPDGGEVKIECCSEQVDEARANTMGLGPGAHAVLSIRDTGPGIDAATLPQVFDPFFSTKPKGEGSGLGLTLVYATVKNHGGHVQVDSVAGGGTNVVVRLPRTTSRPRALEPPLAAAGHEAGQGERIMLVDDEKHLRHMAKRLLEGLGYQVVLAESGEEAEALFRDQHETIDLVILDVVMVGLSGAETLERLREIKRDVRVLVSSGYNRDGEPRHLLDRGVRGFIQKPYGIEEVGQAIRRALTGS